MRNINNIDLALYMNHCANNENPASLQVFVQIRDKALAAADATQATYEINLAKVTV